MHSHTHTKSGRSGSIMLMFTLMIPLIMAMIGLAIDRTILFIVEAKLSGATDGAALGAGRLLGTTANAQEVAGEFLSANFPSGYWGSYALTPTIVVTNVLSTHTVSVSASVKVPLLFMRIYGPGYNSVTATAQATRRDSRIIMVLDRSGSMSSQITNLRTAANQFVGLFSDTDELGLVVFGSSAIVAYPPTRPYNPSPTSAGGPDMNFATSQAGGDMPDMITAMVSGGDTGTAEALSMAYIELQKGHNRDMAAYGVDDRLNAIVLFTDGVPTSLAVNLNTSNTLAGTSVKATSACTYKSTTAAANAMIGWIGVFGIGDPNGFGSGLYLLQSRDSNSALYWMANPSKDILPINPSTPVTNCAYLKAVGRDGSTKTDLTDLQKIPTYDMYNNSTTNSAYPESWVYLDAPAAYDPTKPTSEYHLGIACWNAADNAGNTIRNQTVMNPIAIYTIGYTGNGGVDVSLMKRLANTQDASSYDPNEPAGMYVQVNQPSDLLPAFYTVASSILRLAK